MGMGTVTFFAVDSVACESRAAKKVTVPYPSFPNFASNPSVSPRAR
jgi:hypothetical protein